MRNNRASLTLSLVLSILFFVGLIACAFVLPTYVDALENRGDSFIQYDMVEGIGYGVLLLAAVADVLLLRLLWQVRRGNVFTATNVALLRGLSWCCLLAGALFLWLGVFFLVSFAVAFVAVLVGLCLRVVKNAFAEAILLKEENDYTV